MTIQDIPLNRLVPSPANVRRTGVALEIDALAASIEAHGLLQNLQVRPYPKGKFEVVAGGRRLAALRLLARQKKIAKDISVPCHLLTDEDAGEISLAENTLRLPMHPADQFIAFREMADSGRGVEDIAARFGTSAAVVNQRLRLASVSPALIDLYRQEEMSLDELMAFTVSDDHAAQEAAWHDLPDWQRDPATIRRKLTAAHVEADDRRVRFVGLDRYRAAGGSIIRDLFTPECEAYLADAPLLDRLVAEKLEAEAAAYRAEGWRWVEFLPQIDYATLHSYARLSPQQAPLADGQQDELDRAIAEYDALVDEHGDDPSEDVLAKLDELSAQIDHLSAASTVWQPVQKAVAGVLIGIAYDGGVQIECGLVRAADLKLSKAIAGEGEGASPLLTSVGTSPLSARLVETLTAERTAAMRAVMLDDQRTALAALAHALALPVFYPHQHAAASCLDLRLTSRDLARSAERIEDAPAGIQVRKEFTAWQALLPKTAAELFGWALAADSATITKLLCFCAAVSADAVQAKQDRPSSPRLAHADALASALGLDMAKWWQPTSDNYLSRVARKLILDAVTEAVSPQAADNLAKLKKEALVARAEEKLAGTGWLPSILRSPATDQQLAAPLAEAAE